MTRPARPWRANAWLLLPAVSLLGAAVVPEDVFVAAVEWLYVRLPIHAAVFRSDLLVQTRMLHRACGPAGTVMLGAWAVASAHGVSIASTAVGAQAGDGAALTWRRRIVAALLAYAILLGPVRLLRDGLREAELAGLSYEERRRHVYGRHTLEPDYAALEAFRRRSRGLGALLVLRASRHFDFADVFAASYLFPQRVYVVRAAGCSVDAAGPVVAARPDIRWLQLSCEDGPFAPRPLGPP